MNVHPFHIRSPDVRDFLQLDKTKNFSDVSEDEEDKVGVYCKKVFLKYEMTLFF